MKHDRPTDRDETTVRDPEDAEGRRAHRDADAEGDDVPDADRDGSGKQFARGVPPDTDRSDRSDRSDADAEPKGSGKQYARGVPPDPGPPERP